MRVRATMPPMARTRMRSVGSARLIVALAARGRGALWAAAPVARPRPGPGRAADGRPRCSSAGRSSRCRRSASRSPSAGGCGRSAGSMPPTRPTRSRAGGRSRSSAGWLALAVALLSGIDAIRHHAVLGPHGPARPADARRGPAAGARRADHARPAGQLARDAPALAAAGAPFAGPPGPRAPGHGLDHVRGDDVGGPFLAAVRRVARGPARPRPRARAVPDRRAAVLVAGGGARSCAVADEPPGADRLPVHADDPEHVPRVRHPERDRRRSTRTTRRSSGRGG